MPVNRTRMIFMNQKKSSNTTVSIYSTIHRVLNIFEISFLLTTKNLTLFRLLKNIICDQCMKKICQKRISKIVQDAGIRNRFCISKKTHFINLLYFLGLCQNFTDFSDIKLCKLHSHNLRGSDFLETQNINFSKKAPDIKQHYPLPYLCNYNSRI